MIDELTGKFNGMSIEINKKKELRQLEQAANLRDEHLSTIPEKELDEFIMSSIEDLVLIPSESENTSESDSECDLPSYDDFSPINIFVEKSVTLSNPLFDSNDNFTSNDDESLSDEDVPEDNVKIYLNPRFEFNDEYISSDVNPLFNEVLEDIESEDSYVSKLDEPDLLITPLSKLNEDECFDPGGDVDEIKLLLHRDPSTPKISVSSILEGFNDEPPLKKNDDLFDMESKENEWKKILYEALIVICFNEEDKSFDPGIPEKFFSPTYDYPDYEDSRARGFVHRSLDLPSLACIRYIKKDKNKAKWTKPSTGLEEREKSEAEGIFIFNGPTRTRFMGEVSPLSIE
ncbi:hypothetical protein Tco_0128594 [Tanacetum coccineum]